MGQKQNNIVAGTSRGDTTIDVKKLLDRPWYKYKHLRNLYGWLCVVLLVQATNGLDGSLMNGVQTLPYWQSYFGYPTGAQLGIFNGTQGLGGVISQFFLWWLVDKIGRRLTIIIGSVIIILGVFLQSFANGIGMFVAARLIIGLGLSFEYTAAPMLVTELAHPTHRAQLSTFLNTLYYFGATLAAWITLGTLTIQSDWSWRSVSLIQMLPSLISVSLTWWVPESPRWLISRGEHEKAFNVLVTHHCGGDASDPLATFELQEIQHTLAFERERSSRSWLDLVRTKGNRHRTWIMATIAIAAQATGTTLVGYYLAVVLRGVGIEDPRTQSIINGCLTMWNMAWAFWGASVIDKFGRRPMMLTSLTGMLIAGFVPWTICSAVYSENQSAAAGSAVIAFIFIYSAFYSSTWNGILTGYTVECMSFDIRPKLICTQNLLVQATITGFNYLNPVALNNIGWKYYVIVDILILLEIICVYFTYPETAGITLEEVSVIFDGAQAVGHDLVKQHNIEGEQGRIENQAKNITDIEHIEVSSNKVW
jgi:sugar porter (SP) family MFS transporter